MNRRRHLFRATLGSWMAIALLRPRKAAGFKSLTPCPTCDASRGRAEHSSGKLVDVHCWCESPRCHRCGDFVWRKTPAPYYFNEERQRVIYVSGFAGLAHRCR